MELQAKHTMHTGPAMDRALYRPRRVAELIDVSRSQAYKMIAAGVIRSVRCGRNVRVPHSALVEYLGSLEAR